MPLCQLFTVFFLFLTLCKAAAMTVTTIILPLYSKLQRALEKKKRKIINCTFYMTFGKEYMYLFMTSYYHLLFAN